MCQGALYESGTIKDDTIFYALRQSVDSIILKKSKCIDINYFKFIR